MRIALGLAAGFLAMAFSSQALALPRLKVSPDGRSLMQSDGTPFFWMGDTAWGLAINGPADRELYLTDTASKGFNAAWVDLYFFGFEPARGPNPFLNNDTDTPNPAYWKIVDDMITAADQHGIYLGLLISWPVHMVYQNNPLDKIGRLGQFLGARYANRNNIVWLVAGEYSAQYRYCAGCISASEKAKFETMANAIRSAGGTQLMSIHPGFGSSLVDFGTDAWLGFVIYETGDGSAGEIYDYAAQDWPVDKPLMDGENPYETPIYDNTATLNRRKAYWGVTSGAFGHVYGDHPVTIFYVPGVSTYSEGNTLDWHTSLNFEGRGEMQFVRKLAESKPIQGRIPDQSLVTSDTGTGAAHIQACRGSDRSYAWVYVPDGRPITIDMSKLAGPQVHASWYSPRAGSSSAIGQYANSGTQSFNAPGTPATGNDWVLVLETGIP
jgi:hypothetical protein